MENSHHPTTHKARILTPAQPWESQCKQKRLGHRFQNCAPFTVWLHVLPNVPSMPTETGYCTPCNNINTNSYSNRCCLCLPSDLMLNLSLAKTIYNWRARPVRLCILTPFVFRLWQPDFLQLCTHHVLNVKLDIMVVCCVPLCNLMCQPLLFSLSGSSDVETGAKLAEVCACVKKPHVFVCGYH